MRDSKTSRRVLIYLTVGAGKPTFRAGILRVRSAPFDALKANSVLRWRAMTTVLRAGVDTEAPFLGRSLMLMRFEFSYGDSRFGILTPTRNADQHLQRGRGGRRTGTIAPGRVVFEYGGFRRCDVAPPDPRLDTPGNRQNH